MPTPIKSVFGRKSESLIQNYGLFWHRDRVAWSKRRSKSKAVKRGEFLVGQRSRIKVDFNKQIGIYVLYDGDRRPIYMGQISKGDTPLFSRLQQHTKDDLAERWSYFSWFGFRWVTKKKQLSKSKLKKISGSLATVLNEFEGVMIAATEPPSNRQGARFKEIPKYTQVPHLDVEEVSNKTLLNKLAEISKDILNIKKN
jgi:hypothetical protein